MAHNLTKHYERKFVSPRAMVKIDIGKAFNIVRLFSAKLAV